MMLSMDSPSDRNDDADPPRGSRLRGALMVVLALGVVAAALVFLMRGVTPAALEAAVLHQPPREIATVLLLTAVSFSCLALYDLVGVEVAAKGRVPHRVALLAGATGSAIANTVGFHAVSGTAVRARIYLSAGLGAGEIARIASLSWLSLGAGNATMFAGAELVQAWTDGRPGLHLAIGAGLAAALCSLLAWLARGGREVVLFGHRFPMPSAPLALALMGLGAIESATAIGALYVLLPADLVPPFSLFAAGCIVAVVLGVIAHTPGGIGVFEASLTAMLAGQGRADLLAALLLYRVFYNLTPFALAVLALGVLTPREVVSGG